MSFSRMYLYIVQGIHKGILGIYSFKIGGINLRISSQCKYRLYLYIRLPMCKKTYRVQFIV